MKVRISIVVLFCLLPVLTMAGERSVNFHRKIYKLWYDSPAPNNGAVFRPDESDRPIDLDWENSSLPIGNGYMGASIFGRIDTERIQITDKTLHIKGLWGVETQTAFADLYLDFFHTTYSRYERSLTLNDGICRVSYEHDGVTYEREYFASYPDNVLAVKLTADRPGKLTFNVRAQIPYLVPFGALQRTDSVTIGYLSGPTQTRFSNNGRSGKVHVEGNGITLRGETEYLRMIYEGGIKVIPYGGKLSSYSDSDGDNGVIRVERADSVLVLFTLGTNYQLGHAVFFNPPTKKLIDGIDPHEQIVETLRKAEAKGYKELLKNHLSDYKSFFDRVYLDLGEELPQITTDRLLADYKKGKQSNYLEELLFQYGRYLLISTSRKGTLPPTLQGVWNQYELAPWNGNYTHNINIQMNYWPVFNTNLAELFESYVDYYKAYRETAEQVASTYIKKYHSKVYSSEKGGNGWIVGAGAGAFFIGAPGGHSGPGTGGLTSKLFWDYYAFTSDTDILKEVSYPALLGMARFLSKTVCDTLGYVLVYPSSSPEQFSKITGKPYKSLGCAFDQQMIYENYADVLASAKILKDKDPLLSKLKKQIEYLDPVLVGKSGQIKEYREEEYYDDIVLEKNHRHISNLIGLYPGTIINSNTPEWLKAAKMTLDLRGDNFTGWSLAHKLNLWARLKDGNHAHQILQVLLKTSVLDNLWTNCIAVLRSPYQIEANLGSTAGIAEMLLQSHDGTIFPLPALPKAWCSGHYSGLVARGNFEVSVSWEEELLKKISINSRKGNPCVMSYPGLEKVTVTDTKGNIIKYQIEGADKICFKTRKGESYFIELNKK